MLGIKNKCWILYDIFESICEMELMMKFICEFIKFKILNFIFFCFYGKLLLNIFLVLRKCKRDFKIFKISMVLNFFL